MRDVSTSLDMTEQKEKRLILFDIDSTLIASGGAGIAALKLASKKRFGTDEELQASKSPVEQIRELSVKF